ncbi:MAG: vWA domain-containing protein [Myxococcota bacterium]
MEHSYSAHYLLACAVLACSATPEGPTRSRQTQQPPNGAGAGGAASGGNISASGGTSGTEPASGGQPHISVPTAGIGNMPSTEPSMGGAGGKCGSVHVDAVVKSTEIVTEVPGTILFVFDQSRSMNEDWNGTPKLETAKRAVKNAFAPLADKLSAGAILFPAPPPSSNSSSTCSWYNNTGCSNLCPDVVGIAQTPQIGLRSGREFLTAWDQLWGQNSGSPVLGTPTEKALTQAEAALASPPDGSIAIVLVTDGQPTCGANEAGIAARLLMRGIKTYVVGLPGAQGAAVLDRIAIAGGTAPAGCTSACYYYPDNPGALEEALALVATRVVTTETRLSIEDCHFQLSPAAGSNPNDVHLLVTDAASGQRFEVPRDATNGWLLSADQSSATLMGSTCEAAKAGHFSTIAFEYGCVIAPPLPPR